MNITPITKKYINPAYSDIKGTCSKNNVAGSLQNNFCCPKSIVKNTRIEFSNSRGNVLADIDLADCFVKNPLPAKVSFLADMELSDAYEAPVKKSNKSNISNISFDGKGDKYLYILKQSAIDLYKNTKKNSL